jgi:hypothetical protein
VGAVLALFGRGFPVFRFLSGTVSVSAAIQ